MANDVSELKKMKKFRFQLLDAYIRENYPVSTIADIGGGKGLLAYLLSEAGWQATVIDPEYQELSPKYKTLDGKRIKILPDVKVPRISEPFETEMGKSYDLLVGLHAHACNRKIIDAASQYGKHFILIPCCIINEGIQPESVTDWIAYLESYANEKGIQTKRLKLNFKGQRNGIVSC